MTKKKKRLKIANGHRTRFNPISNGTGYACPKHLVCAIVSPASTNSAVSSAFDVAMNGSAIDNASRNRIG